ncbi:MAG TPA: hypothetical protein VF519_05775 [Mycobacteriales bacterium]|jgi:hypothetical protein
MSHLRLVPPLPVDGAAAAPVATHAAPALHAAPAAPAAPAVPAPRAPLSAYDDPNVVALSFFQSASGICLCRACSMKRHPSYGG